MSNISSTFGRAIALAAMLTMMVSCDSTENTSRNATPKRSSHSKPTSRPEDGPITIAVGLTVEPYVFNDTDPKNSQCGLEVDIVREIFGYAGHKVKFVLEPLKRTKTTFKQKLVDGVLDIKSHYPEIQGAFLSDEYITYHNIVVTLKSSNLKIEKLEDLSGLSVVGFQQARIAFCDKLTQIVDSNPKYHEMANQKGQIAMLFAKRTDAILLDRYIFRYHKSRLENVDTTQPVTYHQLFEPSHYRIAFRNKELCDTFNKGLKKIRESGRYQEIINSYIVSGGKQP